MRNLLFAEFAQDASAELKEMDKMGLISKKCASRPIVRVDILSVRTVTRLNSVACGIVPCDAPVSTRTRLPLPVGSSIVTLLLSHHLLDHVHRVVRILDLADIILPYPPFAPPTEIDVLEALLTTCIQQIVFRPAFFINADIDFPLLQTALIPTSHSYHTLSSVSVKHKSSNTLFVRGLCPSHS